MQTNNETTRRGFLKKATGAAMLAIDFPYIIGSAARGKTNNIPAGKTIVNREFVVSRLRDAIKELLEELETKTGLTAEFKPLDRNAGVVAQYDFQQPNRPIILLRGDWEDVDVAHELMHMRLELVDGYSVLAWRKNVRKDKSIEKAFGLIRAYVDDIVVFERLFRMGLAIDGQIIKRQFFDDICTKVPKYLKEGRSLRNDGMAHFDNFAGGRYGDLRRSAFLVQAELILKPYRDELSGEHKRLVRNFIATFRQFRRAQAVKADKVLAFFNDNNVYTVKGHRKILSNWAVLERLNAWVGPCSYVSQNGGFVLPFPSEHDSE